MLADGLASWGARTSAVIPMTQCQSRMYTGPTRRRLRQNGCHFADDIFKCNFVNENVWISIEISLKFVPKGPINNIPASVQIMAWRRPGNKPEFGPRLARLPARICVTRPQWVKLGCFMIQYRMKGKPTDMIHTYRDDIFYFLPHSAVISGPWP